jgi:hypothetical protein
MREGATMQELYRNDHVTVTEDAGLVAMVWGREEPSDDHAVGTARAITRALDEHLATVPSTDRYSVLVDLVVVKKNFPRATLVFTQWLLGHRSVLKGGAFATKSFLLRAGISAAVLVPGFTMKGFTDADEARRFAKSLI